MNEIKPRLPVKGEYVRHQGVLIDVRKIQPPVPEPITEYIFEERSARKEIRFKDGTVLNQIETLNDFYGLGTGEASAIKELEECCKKKGIGKDSDVEAFVVREIDHVAKKSDNEPNFYDGTFFNFEDAPNHFGSVKHEEIDVWSSKKGRILNDKRQTEKESDVSKA
jgi:hypothetical protein